MERLENTAGQIEVGPEHKRLMQKTKDALVSVKMIVEDRCSKVNSCVVEQVP